MPETKDTFEMLKNAIDQIPIGLMLFSKEKKLLSWNKFAQTTLEVTDEELKANRYGRLNNQIVELLIDENLQEKELIGLVKPYKVKKFLIEENNIILIINESYQEAIGEMSHELRRPITNIKTLAESLLLGAKNDPDIAGKFIEQINNEVDRLTRLVNDLLNISKIRSGRALPSKKELNLRSKVEDAIKLLQPSIDKNKTKIFNEIPDDYKIHADPDQIDHVIQNLIENAIKYSNEGSTVHIKPGPERGSFQVVDTGIGIPKEEISKIFERFYRVDRTKAKGSSGLGLSIVKNVIDIHEGRVEVLSTPGKGSSFIVYLPES